MVRHVNETRHAHVITIEDPIEFIHEPQQAASSSSARSAPTPRAFRDALAAALRQDPDVIVLGEIRDRAHRVRPRLQGGPEPATSSSPRSTRSTSVAGDPARPRPVRARRAGRGARPPRPTRSRPSSRCACSRARRAGGAIPAVEILRATPADPRARARRPLRRASAVMREERGPGVMQLLDQHLQELVERDSSRARPRSRPRRAPPIWSGRCAPPVARRRQRRSPRRQRRSRGGGGGRGWGGGSPGGGG